MTVSDLVKVKPLKWLWISDGWEADDRFGAQYRVEYDSADDAYYAEHPSLYDDAFVSSEEAQGAVQVDYTTRILAALDLTAVEALETEIKRLREALISIDALDPEQQIDGFSVAAMRGLPLRMGEIARAALKEADNARLVRLVEAEDGA